MGYNCKWTEIVLAVVILIVTIWPGLIGSTASWWITLVAAALLLIHALSCKNCGACASGVKTAPKRLAGKKKKKRK